MSEREEIVLLDEQWRPIGKAPKLASHNANTPLHLAFSCYVFNARGETLVTRRALAKKTWPGIWTNTCCGHPAPDEPVEQAVARRLRDELGLAIHDLRLILPRFRYRAEFQGIVENECCPVYMAQADGEPTLNPAEVMEAQWMNWPALKAGIAARPEKYSDWCKLQIQLLEAEGINRPKPD
jgi:isopentenyl-diphosphate delta-isomerase type 1